MNIHDPANSRMNLALSHLALVDRVKAGRGARLENGTISYNAQDCSDYKDKHMELYLGYMNEHEFLQQGV